MNCDAILIEIVISSIIVMMLLAVCIIYLSASLIRDMREDNMTFKDLIKEILEEG